MIINLQNKRSEYFTLPEPSNIIKRLFPEYQDRQRLTINTIKEIYEDGMAVIGTKEGSLESLLENDYSKDSLSLIDKVKDMDDGQLLILPPDYRIDKERSHEAIAYSKKSLISLDSMAVKKRLLEDNVPKGRLSGKRKQSERWSPDKALRAAIDAMHEDKEKFIDKNYCAYSWFGSDNHLRVVSFYRAVQGIELHAFQNMVKLKVMPLRFNSTVRKGFHYRYGYKLSDDELNRLEKEYFSIKCYLKRSRLDNFIRNLDVSDKEFTYVKRKFKEDKNYFVRLRSRSNIYQNYKFLLTGVPLSEEHDTRQFVDTWDIRGYCSCKDKANRSNRRLYKHDEDFFCSHEIAALYFLKSEFSKSKNKISILPFAMPLPNTTSFLDNLRYNTIMLEHNEDTGRWKKRRLNHTEMESLLIKKAIADGYDNTFTTDIDRYMGMGYDPNVNLIRLKF